MVNLSDQGCFAYEAKVSQRKGVVKIDIQGRRQAALIGGFAASVEVVDAAAAFDGFAQFDERGVDGGIGRIQQPGGLANAAGLAVKVNDGGFDFVEAARLRGRLQILEMIQPNFWDIKVENQVIAFFTPKLCHTSKIWQSGGGCQVFFVIRWWERRSRTGC